MIVESVLGVAIKILSGVLNTISMVPLPVAMMDVLFDFMSYGTFVIGADFMAIFVGCIVSWFSIRFTLGLVIFLWELLPFT